MTTVDDPFALPEASRVTDRESILRRGRYMLPRRDGSHKPWGWQRVSNLVSAYSDQYALRLWEIGEVLQGVAMSPELYAQMLGARLEKMSRAERREWAETFIEHAKDASGGNAASRFGTQRHAVVEEHHAGLPAGHHDASTRRHLSLYAAALQRNGLVALPEMQERRVLIEDLEVVGTLDNVVMDQFKTLFIADLKTQRRFWTWLEIAAQLACYAHGDAMWDVASGTWMDMPSVNRDRGMVLWMPRETEDGEPRVDVWEVDIFAGWKTAKRAYEVVKDRAAGKSASNPRAWLRLAPAATEFERWAARFAACDSIADGRTLVDQAKAAGVWDATMARCAQDAYNRIAFPA